MRQYHLAIKRKNIKKHDTTYMNLENFMLCERSKKSQIQKAPNYMMCKKYIFTDTVIVV